MPTNANYFALYRIKNFFFFLEITLIITNRPLNFNLICFQKTKNMLRKRNGSTPVRLTRGLSQKTLDTTDSTSSPTKSPTRTFLLETPVQFTTVRKASRSYQNLNYAHTFAHFNGD